MSTEEKKDSSKMEEAVRKAVADAHEEAELAESAGADDITENAADGTAESDGQETAETAAEGTAESAADDTAEDAAQETEEAAAEGTAETAGQETEGAVAEGTAEDVDQETEGAAAEGTAEDAGQEIEDAADPEPDESGTEEDMAGPEGDEDGKESDSMDIFGRKNKKLLEKKEEQIREINDRFVRLMAEFDNFRKRTEKEKSGMYAMGAKDVIEKILPVLDNFERGFDQVAEEDKDDPFTQGMEMIYRQFVTVLTDLGVKPIEAVGKEFDPNLHNAVMHVEDESLGDNIVAEEFLKGYMFKDTVVRHSMVKVAN